MPVKLYTEQNMRGWKRMSIKKELLSELTEKQLKQFAGFKGITFTLTSNQKKYYDGWDEKEKLVDLMNDHQGVTLTDIENFIVKK